jgi:hypothetical protein
MDDELLRAFYRRVLDCLKNREAFFATPVCAIWNDPLYEVHNGNRLVGKFEDVSAATQLFMRLLRA